MKKILLPFVIVIAFGSCSREENDAQSIIDKTLEASGTKKLKQAEIEFIFRSRKYQANFDNGLFEYVRQFSDSSNVYRDVLTNSGFYRQINGDRVAVPDSMAAKYANSVNAVIYFALLPRGLNDPAVNKEYLGSKEMKGQDYYKIKVSFDEQGGGKDFQDEFIYWVNKSNYRIDYLAYEYHTDGGGMRFRVAYNKRMIEGVTFVDYVNYKPKDDVRLMNIDQAFINEELEKVSIIELQNVEVEIL